MTPHPPDIIPTEHVAVVHHLGLPIGVAVVVTACIIGVLWYLWKRRKKSKPPPKDPK